MISSPNWSTSWQSRKHHCWKCQGSCEKNRSGIQTHLLSPYLLICFCTPRQSLQAGGNIHTYLRGSCSSDMCLSMQKSNRNCYYIQSMYCRQLLIKSQQVWWHCLWRSVKMKWGKQTRMIITYIKLQVLSIYWGRPLYPCRDHPLSLHAMCVNSSQHRHLLELANENPPNQVKSIDQFSQFSTFSTGCT